MADNDFKGAGAGVIGATISGFNCACGASCVPKTLDDGRVQYDCPTCEHTVATVGKANE
jgi:hypothetical protein